AVEDLRAAPGGPVADHGPHGAALRPVRRACRPDGGGARGDVGWYGRREAGTGVGAGEHGVDRPYPQRDRRVRRVGGRPGGAVRAATPNPYPGPHIVLLVITETFPCPDTEKSPRSFGGPTARSARVHHPAPAGRLEHGGHLRRHRARLTRNVRPA